MALGGPERSGEHEAKLQVPRNKIKYGLVKVSTGPTRSSGPWLWADRSEAENMKRSFRYPAIKLNMG